MKTATLPRVIESERLITELQIECCPLGHAARMVLEQTGYWHLRSIDLQSDGHSLTILGEVPSYFLKQLAQVAVMSIPGVRQVHNRLSVVGSCS